MTDETSEIQTQDEEFEDAFNEFAEGESDAEVQEGQEEEPITDEPEPEQQPEPEPEPEADVTSELEKYKQEVQQWQHRYNSDLGRQNAYQKKIQELEGQLQQVKKQQTSNPQGSGMSDKEWKELQEDFPEIAKAVEARINAVASRYENEIGQLKQNLTPIQERLEQQAQAEFKQQQLNILEQQHSDWRDISQSSEFKSWVPQQPPAIQQLVGSMNAADAAYILTTYKREKGIGLEPAPETELKQRRDRQLRQAQTIPARGGRVRGNEPPSDDFDAAFSFFADKVKR